jgi:hypothetical protein
LLTAVAGVNDPVYRNSPIVHHHLRGRPLHFNLVVHPSDLLGLLFQLRSELFNLFLLLLNLSVLFKELVKQHRVHGFVAHGVDFALLVAHDQVGIYLGYFPQQLSRTAVYLSYRSCNGKSLA